MVTGHEAAAQHGTTDNANGDGLDKDALIEKKTSRLEKYKILRASPLFRGNL